MIANNKETLSSDKISVNFRTNVDNRTRDTNMMINKSDTVLHLKEVLNGKGIIENISQCKMIFSGKIQTNDQTFSQVLERIDTSVTPTIHLIGGLCKTQPEVPSATSSKPSEPTAELKSPTTPLTPSTPSTPNSYLLLQKQLLLQQQMLMTQMMMNQLILANSPTLVQSAPAGVNFNSNIFSPTVPSTPLSPFSASAFQPSQNVFNTVSTNVSTPKPQATETKTDSTVTNDQIKPLSQEEEGPIIEDIPENQELQREVPAAAQENIPQQNVAAPQRLIQEENPQPQENAYDYIYTFGKVLLVSTVVFAKEGWVTWILCTLGFFFAILLLKYLNNVIHRRVVRDQERREREEQARLNEESTEETTTIENNVDNATVERGVIGTLVHVVYLFFISLAPTYQPRRRSVREEEEQLHED
ncbi:predicted protein [Naegleria gruberi]|uniref:Predicted protein n=1 Tax=Naegleria gruberi TaxID=5762 RepID=D2VQ74_NAEGR|nr:uncharacterized protein NAEGRDRAFT_58889 [Naegleria gruberi]EFC41059.1 predicted protein [Naegleria gruberi]|eukprot:XP_002673803.1 predicted protein [Naegleria gruberi strain NEG-M]